MAVPIAAYRLTPDGQTFQQPISLIFAYTEQDVANTGSELFDMAFQTADGYWQLADTLTLDTTTKTVTAKTKHFADEAPVAPMRLSPTSATVKIKSGAQMFVIERAYSSRKSKPLGYTYQPLPDSLGVRIVSNWSVNNIPGGNDTYGKIYVDIARGGYESPETKPNPATVMVSVDLAEYRFYTDKRTLTAHVTITDPVTYAGAVTFSTNSSVNITNGVANVTWTLVEDLPDVRTYTASGIISGSLSPVIEGMTCTPLDVTSNITTTDKLRVYTAAATVWPSTYSFEVTADDMNTTLTTDCTDNSDDRTISISFPKLLYAFVGGNCLPSDTSQPVPFTNEAQLWGTYNCHNGADFNDISANMIFTRQ